MAFSSFPTSAPLLPTLSLAGALDNGRGRPTAAPSGDQGAPWQAGAGGLPQAPIQTHRWGNVGQAHSPTPPGPAACARDLGTGTLGASGPAGPPEEAPLVKTQYMAQGGHLASAAHAIPASTLRPWMTLLGAAAAEVPSVPLNPATAGAATAGGNPTPQPTPGGVSMWGPGPCLPHPSHQDDPEDGDDSRSGGGEGSPSGSRGGGLRAAAQSADGPPVANDDEDDYEWKPPPPTCTLCGKHDHPNDCFRCVRAVHVHWARVMELEVRAVGEL